MKHMYTILLTLGYDYLMETRVENATNGTRNKPTERTLKVDSDGLMLFFAFEVC